jgi:hypothetical protein
MLGLWPISYNNGNNNNTNNTSSIPWDKTACNVPEDRISIVIAVITSSPAAVISHYFEFKTHPVLECEV